MEERVRVLIFIRIETKGLDQAGSHDGPAQAPQEKACNPRRAAPTFSTRRLLRHLLPMANGRR